MQRKYDSRLQQLFGPMFKIQLNVSNLINAIFSQSDSWKKLSCPMNEKNAVSILESKKISEQKLGAIDY